MRLSYALRFHRPAGGGDGPAFAQGLTITTGVAHGLASSVVAGATGDSATLSLTFRTNQAGTRFFEWGSVAFPDDAASTLAFSSIEAGVLPGPAGPDGFSQGTVMYGVDGGTGALAGAGGLITSNFLVNLNTDELYDTHLGVLLLPGT
jgi:hypothetical protein